MGRHDRGEEQTGLHAAALSGPWDTPVPDVVLGVAWMAGKLLPGSPLPLDCGQRVIGFYKQFYGIDLPAADFTALTSLVKTLADPLDTLPAITLWLLGGLTNVTWCTLPAFAVVTLVGAVMLILIRATSTWSRRP
jgi:hypothetical protein